MRYQPLPSSGFYIVPHIRPPPTPLYRPPYPVFVFRPFKEPHENSSPLRDFFLLLCFSMKFKFDIFPSQKSDRTATRLTFALAEFDAKFANIRPDINSFWNEFTLRFVWIVVYVFSIEWNDWHNCLRRLKFLVWHVCHVIFEVPMNILL